MKDPNESCIWKWETWKQGVSFIATGYVAECNGRMFTNYYVDDDALPKYCPGCGHPLEVKTMTLSPEDQAKMEKANPYLPGDVIHGFVDRYEIWNLAYTAAKKDNTERDDQDRTPYMQGYDTGAMDMSKMLKDRSAETIAKLEAKLIEAIDTIEELQTKANNHVRLKAERDRLREALREMREYQKSGGQKFNTIRLVQYSQLMEKIDKLLTPQGADKEEA